MPSIREICEDAMRTLAGVQTSHNIIPRHHLPAYIADPDMGLPTYPLTEHEQRLLPEYLRYTHLARQIRLLLDQHTTTHHYDSPILWRCLMTTFLGVGECHETSNRLVIELVKRGIYTLYFLQLVGYLDQPGARSEYNHIVLMIADQPIKVLSQSVVLSDFFAQHTGWVLDGLLNLVKHSSEYLLDPIVERYTDLHHFRVQQCVEFNRNRAVTKDVAVRVEREARCVLQTMIANRIVVPFLRLQTAVRLINMTDKRLNGCYVEISAVEGDDLNPRYTVIDRDGQSHHVSAMQCERVSDVITVGCWVVVSHLKQQQFNHARAELLSYYKDAEGMQRCQLRLDPVVDSGEKLVSRLGVLATKISLAKQPEPDLSDVLDYVMV